MQAFSESITLPSGDIITISTDPVTEGGFMTLLLQHGDVSLSSAVPKAKYLELLRKVEAVAVIASIA